MTNDSRPVQIFSSLLALLIFILAFAVAAWRLSEAPDIFIDEILYTRVGIRVAATGDLAWDNGHPTVIHPPLYFLVEAAYWQLSGDPDTLMYDVTKIFQDVYHARYLNVFFAALTAVLLYWIGSRLKNRWLGLMLALLFLIDPFGLRTNRRAMLETMAGFFVLAGMGLLLVGFARQGRVSLRRALAAGALLGLGMLTKDLAFTAPLSLVLYGLWEWRRWRRLRGEVTRGSDIHPHYQAAFLATAIAVLAALLFPLWVILVGNWSHFVDVKWLALQRLVGLARLTGWNRPGVYLVELLLQRMIDYGTTYLLLALGSLAVVFLFHRWRQTASGRFLAVWGLVLYPFYAFIAVFGGGNDHYYYFLLLPAILFVGYSLAVFPPAIDSRTLRQVLPVPLTCLQALLITLLLLLMLPYNLAGWLLHYGVWNDNGYYRLAARVEMLVPPGYALNASGDRLKFNYFFPERRIGHAATPAEAMAAHIHYFVLVPKDVQTRYGRTTPELAAWIETRGERLFKFTGVSYGPIYLYLVDFPEPEEPLQGDLAVLTISSPHDAPLSSFLLLLVLWGLALSVMAWILRPGAPILASSPVEVYRRNV
jgi:4-amino-4-deoxy-L-arabinose transferase-like glycosyltransferase